MPAFHRSLALGSFALIAIIIGASAGAFGYTGGWISPQRLTPSKMIAALAPPTGPALGHRRNHAKGICFTGVFNANGMGSELSRANAFVQGHYPVVGRFNLGTADPTAPDSTVRVRGMGLQIATPDGEIWRTAMINAPIFLASTPKGFYEFLRASGSKDPNAMSDFAKAHPEFAPFGDWAKNGAWTASYAEERYNSLNAFIFVNGSGAEHAVRWSLIPQAQPVVISPTELAKRGPNFLEQEITERVVAAPQRWRLVITVANPADPTADPTVAWPVDRRTIDVGTLNATKIEPERDGPCREINFDPTILPDGIKTSDDPFPAARSAAYARSYDLRTAEEKYYPTILTGGQQ